MTYRSQPIKDCAFATGLQVNSRSAMLLVFLATVGCCLAVWLALRWLKVKKFWEERGVPHLPPHPVFGSLTFLQRENPALWFKRVYATLGRPYAGMWVFWRPALVVNCPDLARRILVKDADNFRNRFVGSGKTDPIGSLNIFTCNDPLWTSLRRRMTPVFTAGKLRSFQGMVRAKAADLVERIQRETDNKEMFNLRVLLTDFTTDVIGESAFGIKSESAKTGDSVIRRVTREFMEFNLLRGLSWSSIFFLPELVDLSRGILSFFPKHTTNYMRRLFRAMLEQRGKVTDLRDLLDALIMMKQDAAAEGEEMSEDLLLAQAAILLLGGFDTSGATLTMTLYELAHHPVDQEKLYIEIREKKAEIGNAEFEDSQLVELPYLNAVLKESLRKYPPMGWLDRTAEHDYKVDDKLTIPARTVVYVNAMGMHYDPDYFPEPEQYRPERFLPENNANIKPFTYLPFGDGPRSCLGRRFAQQALRFAVSAIVLKFEMRPPPGATPVADVEFEKNGMFYMPTEKLSLIFTPRG